MDVSSNSSSWRILVNAMLFVGFVCLFVNRNSIKELNLVLRDPTELLSGYPLEVRKVI